MGVSKKFPSFFIGVGGRKSLRTTAWFNPSTRTRPSKPTTKTVGSRGICNSHFQDREAFYNHGCLMLICTYYLCQYYNDRCCSDRNEVCGSSKGKKRLLYVIENHIVIIVITN